MAEVEDIVEKSLDKWKGLGLEFCSAQLDQLEGDGVSIQCVNSSEFVVGRQTNFNAPVTIINCAEAFPDDPRSPKGDEDAETKTKEKIVIRDKVLSKSAATTIQELAEKASGQKKEEKDIWIPEEKLQSPLAWFTKDFLKIPLAFWIILFGLLTGGIIALSAIYIRPAITDEDAKSLKCVAMAHKGLDLCLYRYFERTREQNPRERPMEIPVTYVVVGITGKKACYTREDCSDAAKDQLEDPTNVCNFIIGGQGHVYELMGWNLTKASESPAKNNVILCFTGNYFGSDTITYPQKEGAQSLISFGVENGYISNDYVLVASNVTSPDYHLSEAIYAIIKKWEHFDENPFAKVKNSSNSSNITDSPFGKHPIYSKYVWGGKPPHSTIQMKLPVPYVVVSHSVTPKCHGLQDCSPRLINMQAYHFSRNFADIAYNFLVDSDGNVYEGRGWDKRNTHDGFANGRNIDINLIGDFSVNERPTPHQLEAIQYLVHLGLQNGMIRDDYSLLAANSTYNTLSPGKNVYQAIKEWPHFDPTPQVHTQNYED